MPGFTSVGRGSKDTTEIWSRAVPTGWHIKPLALSGLSRRPRLDAGKVHIVQEGETLMASIAEGNSLFEIDMELDGLLEAIQEQVESQGEASEDLISRFQQFCEAHGEKVDRIGRFVRMMEAREQYCRSEAARLTDRARAAGGKVERTKNMVLYYLLSRDLKKIEGYQFILRDRGAHHRCHVGDCALPAPRRTRKCAGVFDPGDKAR